MPQGTHSLSWWATGYCEQDHGTTRAHSEKEGKQFRSNENDWALDISPNMAFKWEAHLAISCIGKIAWRDILMWGRQQGKCFEVGVCCGKMTARTSGGWGVLERGTYTGCFKGGKTKNMLIRLPTEEKWCFLPVEIHAWEPVPSTCYHPRLVTGDARLQTCVGICTAEAERARWERNTWHISSQLIQPVHVIDSVSERVHVHMCVWIEDDPPTLSHIGSGTLAVRGAHLLKTGLIHCLRGRITGKRVTLHIRPCLGEVSQSACMCVPLKDHISDCKSTIGSILAITLLM